MAVPTIDEAQRLLEAEQKQLRELKKAAALSWDAATKVAPVLEAQKLAAFLRSRLVQEIRDEDLALTAFSNLIAAKLSGGEIDPAQAAEIRKQLSARPEQLSNIGKELVEYGVALEQLRQSGSADVVPVCQRVRSMSEIMKAMWKSARSSGPTFEALLAELIENAIDFDSHELFGEERGELVAEEETPLGRRKIFLLTPTELIRAPEGATHKISYFQGEQERPVAELFSRGDQPVFTPFAPGEHVAMDGLDKTIAPDIDPSLEIGSR